MRTKKIITKKFIKRGFVQMYYTLLHFYYTRLLGYKVIVKCDNCNRTIEQQKLTEAEKNNLKCTYCNSRIFYDLYFNDTSTVENNFVKLPKHIQILHLTPFYILSGFIVASALYILVIIHLL